MSTRAGPGELEDTGERLIPDTITDDDVLTATLLRHHHLRYALASAYAKGGRVLDVACGVGFGSGRLAEAGARSVDGLDVDPQVVAYARRRVAVPEVAFHVCAGEQWEAPPYDLIACFDTLEHVADPEPFLERLRRLLHPDGTLFISATVVPTADLYAFHLRDYTPESLRRQVREAGFEIREEHRQLAEFSPAQVRYATRLHASSLSLRSILRRPLHYAQRGWAIYVSQGLRYESLALRCQLGDSGAAAAPR